MDKMRLAYKEAWRQTSAARWLKRWLQHMGSAIIEAGISRLAAASHYFPCACPAQAKRILPHSTRHAPSHPFLPHPAVARSPTPRKHTVPHQNQRANQWPIGCRQWARLRKYSRLQRTSVCTPAMSRPSTIGARIPLGLTLCWCPRAPQRDPGPPAWGIEHAQPQGLRNSCRSSCGIRSIRHVRLIGMCCGWDIEQGHP